MLLSFAEDANFSKISDENLNQEQAARLTAQLDLRIGWEKDAVEMEGTLLPCI